jgi:starch-binding outer membrane protein, SusD/RagB family
METTMTRLVRRGVAAVACMITLATAAGCNPSEKLLEASDPDIVDPSATDSPDGAEALRLGALARFRNITAGDNGNGNESTWLFGGLLVDEWGTASTFVQNDEADLRQVKLDNGTVTYAFRKLHRVRTAVNQALPAMRKWRPTETTKLAELYLARGFAEMQLASDFCNGIPLSNAVTESGAVEYDSPRSVAEVFNVAVATLDSGIAIVSSATSGDAFDVLNALRVTKARALLGLDKVAEAGALVAPVPNTFSYNHTFLSATGSNAIWGQPRSGRRYLVGDSVEGNARNLLVKNAIPFFSSKDPRLPASYTITVRSATRSDTTKSQDGNTNSRTTTLYDQETTVAVANALDARLIESEAKLKAGDVAGWLKILNDLRARQWQIGTLLTPTMPALTDPGTNAARLDLQFREKAFWTFSRGQRLGDLRRLVRFYGRTAENTFPVGPHYRGGEYGPDVNFPVPQEEENNPNFKGCTDRKA